MKKAIAVVSLIGLLCSLGACSRRNYKLLGEKDMKELAIELALLGSYLKRNYVADSMRYEIYREFFSERGISERDWDSSVAYYSANRLEDYTIIYQTATDSIRKVQKALEIRQQRLDSLKDLERRIADGSIDNWNLLPHDLWYSTGEQEVYRYSLTPLRRYTKGVELALLLEQRLLPQKLKPDSLYASLRIERKHKKDTTLRLSVADALEHELRYIPQRGDTVQHLSLTVFRRVGSNGAWPLRLELIKRPVAIDSSEKTELQATPDLFTDELLIE